MLFSGCTAGVTFYLGKLFSTAALIAWTQCPQIVPVEYSVVVPVLPDDGQRIGPHSHNIIDARGGGFFQFDTENVGIGFAAHVFMSAAAGGARTGCA